MKIDRLRFLVAWVLTASLVSAEDGEPSKLVPSGFLGDYSELQSVPGEGDLMVYRVREGVLGEYSRFVLDPPLVYFHPEAEGQEVAPDQLEMLADHLRDALVRQLEKSGRYQVVTAPGSGVARVRVAITDVRGVKPGANVGIKVAGAALGVGLVTPSLNVGAASIEAEVRDSESDERLVAIMDRSKGRRFFNVVRSAKRWGDVKKAFDGWAKEFRKKLDRAHGER